MVTFLCAVLAIVALLGGGVLVHMYLYAHGAMSLPPRVQHMQQVGQQGIVTGEDKAADNMPGFGVDLATSALTRYARQSLIILILVALIILGALSVLLNVAH